MTASDLGSVQIMCSDAMLRNAWISYDCEGRALAMGMIGRGDVKIGEGIVASITVGRDTWSEMVNSSIGTLNPSPECANPTTGRCA